MGLKKWVMMSPQCWEMINFAVMRNAFKNVRAMAFDADDTLWDCQSYFEQVEQDYCELLSEYASARDISASLFETETANMAELGYGSKAFTLSLVENAVRVSRGRLTAYQTDNILRLGRSLLRLPATPLEGVASTLDRLRRSGRFRLAVFTKGELLDQENKLRRSGLERFFDVVSIVSDKTETSYRRLCHELEVEPGELCMVGNSFRSDIAPALAVGACAIHVPFHVTWKHEEAEPFSHERLVTVERFEQVGDVVCP